MSALEGGPGVIVAAPHGAGKSSLLEWAASEIGDRGWPLLRAGTESWALGWLELEPSAGQAGDSARQALEHPAAEHALAIIRDALQSVSLEAGLPEREALAQASREAMEALRALWREGSLPAELPAAWAELVLALTSQQPPGQRLCLLVDEAEWAGDVPWARLLQSDSLWLGVACEEGPGSGATVGALEAAGLSLVRLGRPSPAEIAEMAERRGGRRLAPGVAEAVAARADSPFAVMAWLQSEGAKPRPSFLAAAMYLEGRPEGEQQAAQAGCLVPGWFSIGLIAAMLVRSPNAVRETLWGSPLFVQMSSQRYAFAHPLLRGAIQATLTMEQAGELHKRAAEWLLAQERAGGAPALAQLSVHHHGARQAKEGFAANLAWARHCLRWGLLRCGLEAAQRALLCAAWEESPDHQLGAMALNAILLLALGSASEADTMAQRAASLARDAKNASAEILCLTARALAQRDSDPSKSRELLERARAAARAHHLEPLLEGFS